MARFCKSMVATLTAARLQVILSLPGVIGRLRMTSVLHVGGCVRALLS